MNLLVRLTQMHYLPITGIALLIWNLSFYSFNSRHLSELKNLNDELQNWNQQTPTASEKIVVRVAIVDDVAYYVYQNTFWQAPYDPETGEIDRESATPIDIDDLTSEKISLYFSILDELEQ
jgi:hypothetical protein